MVDDPMDDLDEVRWQHHTRHRGDFDKRLAQMFWISICAALLITFSWRIFIRRSRRWHRKGHSPRRRWSSLYGRVDRISALARAVSLLSPPKIGRIQIFASFSVGQILLIAAYAVTITILIASVDAPGFSTHFVDDLAFRAAWITLTQVPLVYLLGTKRGPLNLLAGLSYERINWVHRWVGRMVFLSATTHMSIMVSSISIVDLLRSPDKAAIVVRYGAGSYGMLSWIVLSSMLPLRRWSYRAFYVNHWISTIAFLWILFKHVPGYARAPIYIAAGILAFDRCRSSYRFLKNNITIKPMRRRFSRFRHGPNRKSLGLGHAIKMSTPAFGKSTSPFAASLWDRSAESAIIVRICDVPFAWRPGQHVRLYLPKLGRWEMHPFTPANSSEIASIPIPPRKDRGIEHHQLLSHPNSSSSNDMALFIRPRGGITQRLAGYFADWLSLPCPNSSRPSSSLTAFVDGPYGTPPNWERYERLVLVATSTGVSFTLSVIDYLEQLCLEGDERLLVKEIHFVWIVRHLDPHFDATVTDMLMRHTLMLRDTDIEVRIDFYTTCPGSDLFERGQHTYDQFASLRRPRGKRFAGKPPLRIINPDDIIKSYEDEDESDYEHSSIYAESAESSTLIDKDGPQSLSDPESPKLDLDSSCWSRMPLYPKGRARRDPGGVESCNCQMIQSRHQNVKPAPSYPFIKRSYGVRPDISSIISSAVERTEGLNTMVATCSNRQVTSQAKNLVADLNFDIAMRRRECGVDIFTECFS